MFQVNAKIVEAKSTRYKLTVSELELQYMFQVNGVRVRATVHVPS